MDDVGTAKSGSVPGFLGRAAAVLLAGALLLPLSGCGGGESDRGTVSPSTSGGSEGSAEGVNAPAEARTARRAQLLVRISQAQAAVQAAEQRYGLEPEKADELKAEIEEGQAQLALLKAELNELDAAVQK